MGEAVRIREHNHRRMIGNAAFSTGEVIELPDGRAGVFNGLDASAANDYVGFDTKGIFDVDKTATMVVLDGQPVYWDHSANKAHFKKVNDRDFYLGTAYGDWASADTTGKVNLNALPHYDVDLFRDPFLSVLVGTAAAGGLSYPVRLGGTHVFELTATNEAQKVDAFSVARWALAANWIVEMLFRVDSDGAGTVVDVSMGVANATHASDADVIAESAFIHLDANNTNINAESDDGTTEVAATDTTKDYTEGVNVANWVHVLLDGRNPASLKWFVDGVAVLTSTTFDISAATGPLGLLMHVEKSAATDTYKISLDRLAVRFMQQDNVQR